MDYPRLYCPGCGRELVPHPNNRRGDLCQECRTQRAAGLTTRQKEEVVNSWPFPWPELLESNRRHRDDLLENAEDDARRRKSSKTILIRLTGCFSRGGSPPKR